MTDEVSHSSDRALREIPIDPNIAVKEQLGAAVRDALLVASALPALVAVLGTHDVAKIADLIGSTGFAPALGVILGVIVIIWRQVRTRGKALMLLGFNGVRDEMKIHVEAEIGDIRPLDRHNVKCTLGVDP